MKLPPPPSQESATTQYIWERSRLAEAFLCAGLAGNVANPTSKAAFNLAEDFLAELKTRNDALLKPKQGPGMNIGL